MGYALAASGTLWATAQDWFSGLSWAGVAAGLLILSGAVLKAASDYREYRRKEAIRDAESKAEEDKIRSTTLSGQIAALTARLEEEAREYREREEHATAIQASLREALELTRQNHDALKIDLERLRKSNHEIRNTLNPITLERDALKADLEAATRHVKALEKRVAELLAASVRTEQTTGRIEAKATRIESQVAQVKDVVTGSSGELPTSLAPDPEP